MSVPHIFCFVLPFGVKGYLLIFLQTYIRGLVGWELGVGERYYFFLQENFRTVDPFHGTNFSQLWRKFFGGKFKWDVRTILDEWI